MYDAVLPVAVGKALPSTANLDPLLGQLYIATTGKIYRLAKATSTVALAASLGLVTAYSAGTPTWSCALAGGSVTEDIVFVPVGQVGSTGTTSLIAGDYFLALVSGAHSFITNNTTVVKTAGQCLAVNSLGYVVVITAVTTASLVPKQTDLQATNTAALTTTTGTITGIVSGLI